MSINRHLSENDKSFDFAKINAEISRPPKELGRNLPATHAFKQMTYYCFNYYRMFINVTTNHLKTSRFSLQCLVCSLI